MLKFIDEVFQKLCDFGYELGIPELGRVVIRDGFKISDALGASEYISCIVKKLPQFLFQDDWSNVSNLLLRKFLKYGESESKNFCVEITQHDLNRDEAGDLSHLKILCADSTKSKEFKSRFESTKNKYTQSQKKSGTEENAVWSQQMNQIQIHSFMKDNRDKQTRLNWKILCTCSLGDAKDKMEIKFESKADAELALKHLMTIKSELGDSVTFNDSRISSKKLEVSGISKILDQKFVESKLLPIV